MEIKEKEFIKPPPEPGICHFWLHKKRRYCNISNGKGGKYCVEHTLSDENGCLLRTACPFTASHTVDINVYHSHLLKCPMRPKYPKYYVENINAGLLSKSGPKFKFSPDMLLEFLEIKQKINSIYNDIKPNLGFKTKILDHWSLDDRFKSISDSINAKKHARQQASLIGHLDKLGLIQSNANYMEFGCGSGEMTKYVFVSTGKNNAMTFLIDRKQIKLKLDQDFKSTPHQRLIIDIKHLDLTKVDHTFDRNAIIYSKHLCGCATDLTLRCLENFRNAGGYLLLIRKVSGFVIALCCHQVCNFESYINHQYLQKYGISPKEFDMLAYLSTWAVCGENVLSDNMAHWTGMTYEDRTDLGYKCKRIIDFGRILKLKSLGANCELVFYIEKECSRENLALVGTWDN